MAVSFVAGTLLLSSCGMPKNIVYFQDVKSDSEISIGYNEGIVAQPNDELSIVVNSQTPELPVMFNLPVISLSAGRTTQAYNQYISTYAVNEAGDIDFPVLGKIHVGGLTRDQIATKIKDDLVSAKLIDDPVVTVDFANVFFSVTGEVNKPGRFPIDRDRMTVLDALAQAGDLTIFGERPSVKVFRIEEGKQKAYLVDLTNAEQMTQSPAYFIRQNDIIYVSPNAARGRQSTVNGNNLISYSFWLSLASVLTSMAVLIFK